MSDAASSPLGNPASLTPAAEELPLSRDSESRPHRGRKEKQNRMDGNQEIRFGLDIGTSRIVLAQNDGERIDYRSQLNAFVTLPHNNMTTSALEREHIPHSVENGSIFVVGNESARFADLFRLEPRRPMTRGVLNPQETRGREQIRQLLTALANGKFVRGRKIYFSIPAPTGGADESVVFHEAAIRQMLHEFGMESKSIPEGLAVIYAELQDSNYSGIGISCGGGMCNVCLAYLSVPIVTFSIPRAGDFVDESAAAVTGEVPTRIRLIKEQAFHFNGTFADKVHQAIAVYYDDLIQGLVRKMVEQLAPYRNLPTMGRALPVVLSGGSALPKGFVARFEKALLESEIGLPISEVKLASDPLHATAKGALAAALSDF